jgi:hypothetical protein
MYHNFFKKIRATPTEEIRHKIKDIIPFYLYFYVLDYLPSFACSVPFSGQRNKSVCSFDSQPTDTSYKNYK